MDKYFLIRGSWERKVIGTSDGLSTAELVPDKFSNKANFKKLRDFYDANPEVDYFKRRETIPDFHFEFEYVRLVKHAKAIDFLQFFPNGFYGGEFLLSERALNILMQFKLPPHKVLPAKIFGGKTQMDYWFVCSACLPLEVIDFDRTIFATTSAWPKLVEVKDAKDFAEKRTKDVFRPKTIWFNERVDTTLDYFTPSIAIPDIFISNRLRKAIEQSGLTGLNIIPQGEPSPHRPVLKFANDSIM